MDVQDFRSLQEAYLEVYQELDEERVPVRKRGGVSAPEGERSIGGEENRRNKDYWASVEGRNRDRGMGSKAKRRAAELNKEEIDIYDIILSHLLDEGYAETPEAAEAIMVNMSEEWREDIMEGYKRYPAKKVGNKLDRMYNDPDTDTRFGKTGKRYGKMMDVDSHMKGEVHSLIRAHSPKKSKAKETENRKRGEKG